VGTRVRLHSVIFRSNYEGFDEKISRHPGQRGTTMEMITHWSPDIHIHARDNRGGEWSHGDDYPRIPRLPTVVQGSGSPQILCPNLIQFGQVIVSKHLWDPPDQISSWAAQLLFGQVGLVNAHSQLPVRILSNSDKKFERILIRSPDIHIHARDNCGDDYPPLKGTLTFLMRSHDRKSHHSRSASKIL